MNIKDTITNFLYDKEYFINIYEDYIHIYNYLEIIKLTNTLIILKLNKFKLEIKGNDLNIKRLDKKELLIKGIITKVGFIYE